MAVRQRAQRRRRPLPEQLRGGAGAAAQRAPAARAALRHRALRLCAGAARGPPLPHWRHHRNPPKTQ